MRVVLDTNVLVSATLIRDGNEDRILRAWRHGAFDLVLSQPILEEVARVFAYQKVRKARWISDLEMSLLLEALTKGNIWVPGNVQTAVSRDPDDDKFLAAAAEARARYLVTGDKDLLSLLAYGRTRIITPAAFLKILR